jgi:hypothetical protein
MGSADLHSRLCRGACPNEGTAWVCETDAYWWNGPLLLRWSPHPVLCRKGVIQPWAQKSAAVLLDGAYSATVPA